MRPLDAEKNVVAVIQARLKCSRLPEKILRPIGKKTMLEQVYNRVCAARGVTSVVVAVPTGDVETIFNRTGIAAYGGPEEDLLTRILIPARALNATHVMRITADCPLIDPAILETMVEEIADYPVVTNTMVRTFPNGMDAEIYERDFLEDLSEDLKGSDREWFYSWCLDHLDDKRAFMSFTSDEDLSMSRLTVDYPEDLKVVRMIYKAMREALENEGYSGEEFIWSMHEVVAWLRENPKVMGLNRKYIKETGARP